MSPPGEYFYTGAEQTYTVPANVTGVHVVVVGAKGASCCGTTPSEQGGFGAQLTGDVPLPTGTATLYVEVGGNGTAGAGGWNGGGNGPLGGGGASDIRTVSCSANSGNCATGGSPASLNSRLAVAGGGGGASAAAAGGSTGDSSPLCSLCGGTGTTYGPGAAASAASMTAYCKLYGDTDGEVGTDGSLGLGGVGASFLLSGTPESGGGGGGWYGGGGGGQCYDSPGAVATAHAGAGGGGSDAAPTSSGTDILYSDSTDPPEVIVSAPVPTATTTPAVAGGLSVGDVLSESHAVWASAPRAVSGYAYQWERCNAYGAGCTAISGATAQTYTLVAADLGGTIRVQETAENFYGSSAAPSTSAASGVIGEPPRSTVSPAIAGTPTEGQVLQETHGSWTDAPITAYHYVWERCSGGSCAPISGAASQSYTLTAGDVGSTIEVQETAVNAYGTSAPATSAATSAVQRVVTRLTLRGSATASATAVSFSLLCHAATGTSCRGAAQLVTVERRAKGKIVALAAKPKPHSRRALVGARSFRFAAGAQRKISVPLNRLGRKLLARFHRIPATLTIALLDTSPHTKLTVRTTIRSKKKPKHHG